MRFKGDLKKVFLIISILMIAFTVNSRLAYAEDFMELKSTIDLDNNMDDFTEMLTMKRDGNIILNFTVKDRDTKPSQISLQIKNKSDGKIVYEVDGITEENGIVNQNVELDKGEYRIDYKLYNNENEFRDTYARIYMVINKTYRLIDSPSNIKKLAVNAIKQADEESKDYNLISFGGALTELVIPFTTKYDGCIMASLEGSSSLEARIYEDKSCTKAVGNKFTVDFDSRTTDYYTRLPKKGTYYIKFILKEESSYYIEKFKITLDLISEEDRSLKEKVEYLAYQDKFSGKTTYKISVPEQGTLQLVIKPLANKVYDATIQLYDKNMNKLTPKDNITAYDLNKGNTMYQNYSLKKGTYYVQLENKCGFYTIRTATGTLENMGSSSKSSAKNINVGGSEVTGNLFVTDNKTDIDWFKFTLKSKSNLSYNFSFYSDGINGFGIIDSKGNVVITMDEDYKEGMYIFTGVQPLDKGTYYIKVYKKEKYSSMSYIFECSYY
jgi:hypothetical protein